jgi:hypothetical protein
MNRFLAAFLMLFATAASAQQFVTVVGPVGPGNCPIFSSTTILKDSGGPCAVGVGGTVTGPITSTVNGLALWNNLVGGTLKDGPGQTVAGNYTWSGGQTYSNNALNTYTGQSTLVVTNNDPLGQSNSSGDRAGFVVATTWDNNLNTSPGFVFSNAAEISNQSLHGVYNFGNLTFTKSTFIGLNINATYFGAGQKDALATNTTCYSKGDCSTGQNFVTYANFPTNGDEGTGWGLASRLTQLNPIQTGTIVSTSKNTCNTTLTQAVTGSFSPQTVNVLSGTGCTVNTWIVVNREAPTGSTNHEGLQITASTSTSITGVFTSNYNNGMTITPALDMVTSGLQTLGEGRILVNVSTTPYTTGTIASIAGGAVTGSGTGWTVGMVGGDTLNPGCLNMAADDYSSSPFGAGSATLHSYFQVYSLGSMTTLSIWSFSTAGSTAYAGKGPGTGAYRILPCSEVLRIVNSNEIILADPGFTWANGNTVELAIPPYPDVTGFQWQLEAYTNGGNFRTGISIANVGARKFGAGIIVASDFGPIGNNLPGADNNGFQYGVSVSGSDVGFCVSCAGGSHFPTVAAIALTQGAIGGQSDIAGRIVWGPASPIGYIQPNAANVGIDFAMVAQVAGGVLSGIKSGLAAQQLLWPGFIRLGAAAFGALPACASGIEGALATVTDSTTATWGATVTGAGSNHVMARCNGTNWTVMGS